MKITEQWKAISGYTNLYAISNRGRVRSLKRYVKSKANSKRVVQARILRLVTSKQTPYKAEDLLIN